MCDNTAYKQFIVCQIAGKRRETIEHASDNL